MPLYEYRCNACGHLFEVLQRLGQDGSGLACPECGAVDAEKRYSTFSGAGSATGCSPRGGFT